MLSCWGMKWEVFDQVIFSAINNGFGLLHIFGREAMLNGL